MCYGKITAGGFYMSDKNDELEKILNEIKNGKSQEQETNFSINESKKEAAPEQPDFTYSDESKEENVPQKIEENDSAEFDLKEEQSSADDTSDSVNLNDLAADEYSEEENIMKKGDNKKKIIIAIIAVAVVVAVAVGLYFGVFAKKEEPTTTQPTTVTTTAAPVVIRNPLTGEADYNTAAVGKRPISVVVENSKGARPQYNMDTPDIIVEGEVEGGETRMLWFYADQTNLPEMVGPNRSARPSYVIFSKFFDSIFVHYGGSHSKGDYVGGYETIKSEGVDDVDGIYVSSCFKRTKDKVSPHNAVLLGDKLLDVCNDKGYRLDLDENNFSKLAFNEKLQAVSTTPCQELKVKISDRTATHTLAFDSEKGVYTNENDYGAPVSFTNVLVMFAESTYIDKQNYKGSGKTETYLNYTYTSGTGKYASNGTIVDFNWKVENDKLYFTDTNGKELKLNPGKSWICLASSNHNGSVEVTAPAAE